ncbi:MAG: efflux RND transporter permease subunit [Planctomycetaceae bacterium]|nr:MAG: efflux RND transporter permease subunit [Planctomycetaceae bacterium]
MYKLAEICVNRPVFALMLITALVVAGLASYPQLGVDRFPNIDMAQVSVRADYPGAAATEVESEVTAILEDAVATVAGIDELRSISWDAQSLVMVTFQLDRDTNAGVQDIRDAVSAAMRRLPRGIDPPVVQKRDIDSSPILSLAVAGPRSPRELFLLADQSVKNTIESAKGVGQVVIAGSAERAIQIDVSADRLAANRLSILEVRDAVERQNAEIPGGRMDQGMRERIVRTQGRLDDSDGFANLVVATRGEAAIRLGDVAEIRDATKEVRTLARLDGEPAVVLQVQRQSGENTVEVIDDIKRLLPRAQALLPEDVRVTVVQDQSRYIRAALHEIEQHLIFGSILACLTVLMFMRSWRSTVIASVAIPTSIIATFAFMRAFGFTLNNVTMLALVLMVGVVIDDAIVVLENIFRHIEEKGASPREAAIRGTREIGPAVVATTLSLVIVFLPVSFLSSVTGRMLFQFGITATVAILISMLVSFTLTPMMCSKMLRPVRPRDKRGEDGGESAVASRRGLYGRVETAYLATLRLALRGRWAVLALVVVVIASNFALQARVQRDYIPLNVDESEFEIRVEAPRGSTIPAMRETVDAVEAELADIEGIEKVVTTVGSSGFGDVNRATFYIRLVDSESRTFSFERLFAGLIRGDPGEAFRGNYTQRQRMADVRKRLNELGDLQISVRNLTSLRQGSSSDVDFSITGPNLDQLMEFSDRLLAKARELPPLADTYTTLVIDNPELLVSIDRERAAALGVDVTEIADTLRIAVGGDDRVSRYLDSTVDEAYDVEVRLVGLDRRDIDSISQLYVRTGAAATTGDYRSVAPTTLVASPTFGAESGPAVGHTRLDNLVDFEFGQNASRIDRLGRQKMVAVRGNIASGYGLTDGLDAMWAAVRELGVPPELDVQVLGGGRELDRTMLDFRWTFLMSLLFMYIVLAAQYEHLVYPLIILLSLPLAVPFGLLSLYWGGETLNLYSAMGVLVLFGVVKKAAILQVDHTNVLRRGGMPREQALLQANRDRLRPILMTTVSFVAGLLPLLIATGPGAEERRSIAVLVVGGQTLSLVLTLIAIPVLYTFFDDLTQLVWKPAPDAPAEPVVAIDAAAS